MRQISILLLGLILLTSCNSKTQTAAIEMSPVDSLISVWLNNWNSHDSVAIKNMFEDDVILMDNDMIARSQDEVVSKLIRPNISRIKSMKAEKINEWVSDDRAFFAGTYILDVIVNDSLIDHPKGFWTVCWKKNDKDGWKISSVHINSVTGEP